MILFSHVKVWLTLQVASMISKQLLSGMVIGIGHGGVTLQRLPPNKYATRGSSQELGDAYRMLQKEYSSVLANMASWKIHHI